MKQKLIYGILSILICVVSGGAQTSQSKNEGLNLTAQQWREDLQVLATEMPKRHKNLFHTMTREQFETAVKQLDAKIPTLSQNQIALEFARIVSMVQDGHTGLWLPFAPEAGFHALPIKLYLFKEGLFVQSAAPEYAAIVGGKVIRIGSETAEKAIEAVGEYIPKENLMGVKNAAPMYLISPEVLQALGIIKDAEKVDLQIEKNGKQFTAEVKPAGLFANMTGAQARKSWVDARDSAKSPTPLWLKNEGSEFWFEYIPESKTLYVQFNQVLNKADETVESFFGRIGEALNKTDVDKLVLDIRLNGGGNNGLVPLIIRTLVKADKIDQKGKLFVIIGRQTFSAAQNLTNELEKYTKAVFVGEPTASHVNMFGDARGLILPNSKLRVNISTLWWQNMAESDKRQWTPPNVSAELTFADYANNIDPAMKAVLEYKLQKSLREIALELFEANDLKSFRSKAIEYKNNPVNVYQNIEAEINLFGYRLITLQKFNEAIEMFKLNVELYPESANVYDSLGDAYENQGNKTEAIKNYEKALQIDPKYPSSREALQRLKAP
jgi:tetratricopeptide (TPR) repeat protein